MTHNKFEKYGLIFVCILIMCGNICSYFSYSQKYGVDIYSRLFPIIIIFEIVIFSILGWNIIHLNRGYQTRYNQIMAHLSIFIAVCARLMILYLPHISGIAGYVGDHNTHSVYIYEIVSNGAFHIGNYYPFAHIVAATTHLLTDIPILSAMYFLIGAFLIVFVGGVYMLAKTLLKSNINQQDKNSPPTLVLLFALIGMMIPTISYAPHNVSNLLYPIIFGICLASVKTHRRNFVVLAAIILLPFSFYHPAGALFLCISYIGYLIATSIFILIDSKSMNKCLLFIKYNWIIIILFIGMIAIFLFWSITINHRFDANIRQIIDQIFGLIEFSGGYDKISMKLDKAGITNIVDVLILGLKMYGFKVVTICISFISFITIYLSRAKSPIWTPMLGGIFGISGLYVFLYGLSLIGLAGSKSISLGRFEAIILTFTPLFVGFFVYYLYIYTSRAFLAHCLVVIICIVICVFGIVSCFSAYPSPFIEQGTPIISEYDLLPYHWSFVHGPTDVSYINQPLTAIYRIAPLAYLHYNDITIPSIIDISGGLKYTPTLSDHFGYNKSAKYLSTLIGNDVFIPIREYDRIIYDKIYTKLNRLNSQDFSQLEMDWSVNKVYTNKGYSDMYLTM